MWEFEFPLARTPINRTAAARGETNSLAEIELEDYYVAAGGSVARLDNGNYIVAFTQIDDVYGETAWRNATRVFEVHADGSVNSQVMLPAAWHHFASGAWRAVTLDSMCGESEVCPAQIAADAELAVGLCDSSFSGDDWDDDQGGVIAEQRRARRRGRRRRCLRRGRDRRRARRGSAATGTTTTARRLHKGVARPTRAATTMATTTGRRPARPRGRWRRGRSTVKVVASDDVDDRRGTRRATTVRARRVDSPR